MSKLSKNLKTFASSTTIHGIPVLLNSKSKYAKAAWLTVMVLSLSGLAYMSYLVVSEFVKEPTTLVWNMNRLEKSPMVTVVAQNVLNRSKIEALGLSKLHITYLIAHDPFWQMTPEDNKSLRESDVMKLQKDIDRVRMGLNLSMPDLLKHITLDWGSLIHVDEEFNVSLSLQKFNSFGMTTTCQEILGEQILAFKIKPEIREEPVIEHEYLKSHGFAIAIGGLYVSLSHAFKVNPYTSNAITLRPEFTHLVNRPKSPCDSRDVSEEHCNHECLQSTVEWYFNCTWWFKNPEESDKALCFQRNWKEILDTDFWQTMAKCDRGCLPPCKIARYFERIDLMSNMIPEKNPENYTNKFYVVLREGWRATTYEESYVYSWSSFVSNIGGLIGLFFGASLLSFIHLGLYMFLKPCVTHQNDKC